MTRGGEAQLSQEGITVTVSLPESTRLDMMNAIWNH